MAGNIIVTNKRMKTVTDSSLTAPLMCTISILCIYIDHACVCLRVCLLVYSELIVCHPPRTEWSPESLVQQHSTTCCPPAALTSQWCPAMPMLLQMHFRKRVRPLLAPFVQFSFNMSCLFWHQEDIVSEGITWRSALLKNMKDEDSKTGPVPADLKIPFWLVLIE